MRPALLFCLSVLLSLPVCADSVDVAVAANFAGPMAAIAERFHAATGHDVRLSPGATGKLYAQVANGAPFDVFLSADEETPRRLVAEGFADGASRFTYAVGALVLWSPDAGLTVADGAALKTGTFSKLAIANPKTAPYGRAAIEVLGKLGVLAAVEPKLVQGESIAQAFQFVRSGNATLGFVGLSQVLGEDGAIAGSAWRVPEALHAPIRQDAVLLKHGRGNVAAAALLAYLKGDAATTVMRRYGYTP